MLIFEKDGKPEDEENSTPAPMSNRAGPNAPRG
jgi:hypothetical protein